MTREGTGKTTIALEDIHALSRVGPVSALVLVPTIDLSLQWQEAVTPYLNPQLAIEITTYAGIARRYFQEDPHAYQYIVVDEAHHGAAPVLKKVIQHYQPTFLLGLTATDQRLDARRLEDVFGHYEEKLDLKKAIEQGLLAQIRAFRLESNLDLSKVRFNGSDYVSQDLERIVRVHSRNELIADVLHEYFHHRLPEKSGLIFCVNVAHAREMARLMKKKGFTAESVDGTDPKRQAKVQDYMAGKTQFLCTCSLLNEGWDAPHTSVVVMARPTLSKVLYTQQLGRGTRKAPGKEALYVIDVVDRYGSFGGISNAPWSVHALLGLDSYTPFGDLISKPGDRSQELIDLETTFEKAIKLQPFDLFTMQKTYGDYLSVEALARTLFVSTGSVKHWILSGEIRPDISLPLGRSPVHLFHPDQVATIRQAKGLTEHTEETIVEDFWEYIEERSYSYGYKMFFILALLAVIDSTGDADLNEVLTVYRSMYLKRHERGQPIDRPGSPYHSLEFLTDDRALSRSLLSNPFEKFERKRFMYHARDVKKISIHHRIWDDLIKNDGIRRLKNQMLADLKSYYESLGKD